MRYCNFILHAYSQMYDGPVHGHAPDTHAHRTTRTRLNWEDATRTCNTATLQKSDTTIRCSVKFCARGSLCPPTAPNTAHMREESGRRTCRPRCRREPEPRARKGGEYVRIQDHGQRKCARIGAPRNEELVEPKIPAEGGRAERAEEPSLLIGVPTPLRSAMQSEQGKGARTFAIRESLSGKLR